MDTVFSLSMIDYSGNFQNDHDTGLISRYEEMIRTRDAYYFDVEELENIADFYLEKGNFRKATKVVEYGLDMFPQSTCLLLKKANVLIISGKASESLETLNFLEQAEPANTDVLLLKAAAFRTLEDHDATKECIQKAISYTSENKEELFLDLAFEQEMMEDFDGAIDSIIQSLHINPNHETSLYELAYCYDMSNKLEEGVAFLQRFLDDHPYNHSAWFNLAGCYEKLGQFENAITALEYALVIREDLAMAYVLKGNCYLAMEMQPKALEAFLEAVIYDQSNPHLFCSIGECYENMDDMGNALANYERALAIDETNCDALMGIGVVKENEGKILEAINFYQEAIKADDTNLDNWLIYTDALVEAGRISEALDAYEIIVAHFEEAEAGWIAYADLLAEQVSLEKAVEILGKAMLNLDHCATLSYKMTELLLHMGMPGEAEFFLTKGLELDYEGHKTLLSQFPGAIQFTNIARLIELYKEH